MRARRIETLPEAVILRLRAAAAATTVNEARTWLPEGGPWRRALRRLALASRGWTLAHRAW